MTITSDFRIQQDRTTQANRYPHVFDPIRRLCEIENKPAPKILSFGCSTGEEPYCLANDYFKKSQIIGLDVWPAAVETAKSERSLSDRIVYDISSPQTLSKYGPYDIIFAMSVLCRWPDLADKSDASNIFPFEQYYEMIKTLDMHLVPGGILAIYNSNYDFSDTRLISGYEILLVPGISDNGYVKHFDKRGREITGYNGTEVIYRKMREAAPASDVKVLRFMDERGRSLGRLSLQG